MSRPGEPLEHARSPWLRDPPADLEILGVEALCFRRRVNDGTLSALVALEPHGWHLSISFASHKGAHTRYPRFDEIADARYRLLPPEITVAMILPPPEEYVAVHMTTFHLHEIDPDALPPEAEA